MSVYVYRCEWNGCRNVASDYVHRGFAMKQLRVCERHRKAFHDLSDVDAFKVSMQRQAVERKATDRFTNYFLFPE